MSASRTSAPAVPASPSSSKNLTPQPAFSWQPCVPGMLMGLCCTSAFSHDPLLLVLGSLAGTGTGMGWHLLQHLHQQNSRPSRY